VITPHFRGLQDWKHLSGASSLCGACTETCPVKIDIHHHLLHNRRNAVAESPVWWEKLLWFGFKWVNRWPGLYRIATRLAPFAQKLHPLVKRTPLDPLQAWTNTREFPEAAPQSFHDWMEQRKHLKK
jgi:L-lactate dehydrogenase complex protein LldF